MPQTSAQQEQTAPARPQTRRPRFLARQIDVAGMQRWLRSRYPQKTAACVAADIGISADTVERWFERNGLPKGRELLLMVCAYGPDFLAALLTHPPEWLQRDTCEAAQAQLESRLAAFEADLARQREQLAALRRGTP